MMYRQRSNLWLAAFLAAVGGCAHDDGPVVPDPPQPPCSVEFSLVRTHSVFAPDDEQQFINGYALARFDTTSTYADAGPISFNGSIARAEPSAAYGFAYTFTAADAGQFPYSVDGRWYRLSIAGAGTFPAIVDSVQAPPSEPRILSPGPGDTVAAGSTVPIRWQASADSRDSLFLLLLADSSGSQSSWFRPDNGNAIITALPRRDSVARRFHVGLQRIRHRTLTTSRGHHLDLRLSSIYFMRLFAR